MKSKLMFLILPALFAAAGATHVYAQFKVVYLKGQVQRKAGGKTLQVGDQVQKDEEFLYKTNDAVLAIYNDQYGRYVLPEMKNANLEAGALGHTAGAVAVTRNLTEVAKYIKQNTPLNGGKYLVLGDEAQIDIMVNDDNLRKNFQEKSQYFVRYVYKGDTMEHQLTFNSGSDPMEWDYKLHLNASEIYRDKAGNAISPYEVADMPRLVVRGPDDNGAAQEVFIDFLNPIFVAGPWDNGHFEQKLRSEVDLLLNALGAAQVPPAQQYHIVNSYINKNYGRTLDENLSVWMKKNFNFSK